MTDQAAVSYEGINQSFGYKQELRRALRLFSLYAVAFSIISITTGLFANYGFGLAHLGPSGSLNGLSVAAAQKSNGMTRSAIAAVERLARSNGKPIAVSSTSSTSSGSSVSPLITFGAPVLLVVLGALLASRIRRRTS